MEYTRETLAANRPPPIPGMYDPLTELYNRPLFVQVMESLLRISIRQHMPVTLAIASIKNFSELKDLHTEDEIDTLVKNSADVIKAVSRDSDVLGHIEEDQFALLLYNCDSKNSHIAIDRLRSQVWDKVQIDDENVDLVVGQATFGESHNAGSGQAISAISDYLFSNALKSLESGGAEVQKVRPV
ncbi:GGDEF domain-containing protein [Vibrio sp. HN007]|uniref:GGDEF domain-containing protein n=1 Tax=Vibrio iocasae TaxID=3098914 RepID=UPI0035D45B96